LTTGVNPNRPYRQRLEQRGGSWFARVFETAGAEEDAGKPEVAEALLARGNMLQGLRRFEEALASYDKVIAFAPEHADAFYNRGIALSELKRTKEAVASRDRAIALAPDYVLAFNNRGNALQVLKHFEEAVASYDRAIALKPDYADAFYNRGMALQALRRSEEAVASYERTIALAPGCAETFNNRGKALAELRRLDEALASYDQAIAIKPDYPEAFNNRGHLLKDEGRQAEALRSLERALSLKTDYADAKLALCMAQLPILPFSTRTSRRSWRGAPPIEVLSKHCTMRSNGKECHANGPRRWERRNLFCSPTRDIAIVIWRDSTAPSCAGSWPSSTLWLLSLPHRGPANGYGWAWSAVSSGSIRFGKFRSGAGSAKSTAGGSTS
jgi:tetratricopeptide (TPR) repeat protein